MTKHDDQDTLDFSDLTPIEIEVPIGKEIYILREASGDAARRYQNALLKGTKLGPNGKPERIEGMADADPLLVSLCLFSRKQVGERTVMESVPQAKIMAWPAKVYQKLAKKIKKISELDDTEDTAESLQKHRDEIDKKIAKLQENEAKNAQDGTTDGSDSQVTYE